MTNKEFIKQRRALHISQGRIARRARVSQSLVSEFEVGYRALSRDKVAVLEAALNAETAQASRKLERLLGK
jgi:predicted transcriptional regulator